jgi:hypothetical protein
MMATLSTLRCVISFSSSSSSSSSVKSNNKNLRVIGRHQKYRTFLRAKRDDEEKNDENSKLPEFEVGSKIVSARASRLHFSKTWRSYHRLRRFLFNTIAPVFARRAEIFIFFVPTYILLFILLQNELLTNLSTNDNLLHLN